jgi:tricorn protease
MKSTSSIVAVTLLVAAGQPAFAQEGEARLLRFPAIHGNRVAFSYAGNLYTALADGGVARRLTNHDGYEMFARYSPDGRYLAFTGQYDGNTEVYVMPSDGGRPRRLTFTATLFRDEVSDRMGPNNIVMGWRDSTHIIFRSRMREWNDFIGQLYTVDLEGHMPEQIPVPRGGFCSFSPDGKKMAYNRIFREFRTWKRYRGGMADDIWVHDFETKKTEAIASDPAVDDFPMWHKDRIYFLSDRKQGGALRFNLYSYELPTKKLRQQTDYTDYDIKYPSLGDDAIVYENAGYIYRFDLKTEKASKISIKILDDHLGGRGGLISVSGNVGAFEISPDGKRALFSARGDLFTVPAKEGVTRNLTNTSGVHERNPKWSPDGKTIAYISDASGEDEIHVRPADGSGEETPLTQSGPPYKYHLVWSPDSKKIMWADKLMRLFMLDVAAKKTTQIAKATAWEIKDYVWSPDSKWIAYAMSEEKTMQKVFLYGLADGKTTQVTDGWYDSFRPEFSGDGKYLFFVSERDFNPVFSATEWNHAYVDMSKLYFVTLAKDTPNPFAPKSDDEKKEEKKDSPKDMKDAGKDKETKKDVKIDLDGLGDRVLGLPVAGGNYDDLVSVGGNLYYRRTSRRDPGKNGVFLFDVAAKKEHAIGNLGGFEISANGQKMLVQKDLKYYIIDLPKGAASLDSPLDLTHMQVNLDRTAEWKQIFHESWRQMRDYFYDPALHGVEWKKVRERYEPLLPHVNHRADLTYLIGEMISELCAGHAYVGAGDLPKVHKIPMGLLGAEVRQDKTGAFQITRILKGATWDKSLRAPLAEIGIDVKEGEYIIAVDGKPTKSVNNLQELLINKVGRPVHLKIAPKADLAGARDVTVVPTGDEHPLYYHAWVQGNIKKVEEATKGEVGYLHIPDMLATGLNEFAKHYYPQIRKKGLIIDVRGNGGGNVSPMIIERLRREMAMIKMSRDTAPVPNPEATFLGPMLCLMNEFSASDGDLFPYRFRFHKLGKLVGKRSWGGVIGIRGTLPFIDGGSLNKPEFASYDTLGKKWIIENHGVDPDVVVDNDPAREFAGTDDQLLRAIEVIREEMRMRSVTLPALPPFPKR